MAKRPKGGNRMHLQLVLLITETFFALVAAFLLKMKNLSDSPVIGYLGQMIVVSLGTLNLILWFPKELNQRFHLGESFSLGSNELAYSCYRSQGHGNPSETWMVLSEDDGQTWTRSQNSAPMIRMKPHYVIWEEGELLAATRTHIDHHVKLCELTKTGKRWKEKFPLTLPMQHPADLTALSDKCLLTDLRNS